MSLVNYIRTSVDPREYWKAEFGELNWPTSGSEARVKSTLRAEETTPSLSLNGETGAWFDHGLGKGGKSIVSYHSEVYGIELKAAAEEIYGKFVRPVIDSKKVRRLARSLKETPTLLGYVVKERMVSQDIVDMWQLGTDGRRIWFPVKDEYGLFVNAKGYLIDAKKHSLPKMVNYTDKDEKRSFGSPPMIYPLSVLLNTPEEEPVVIAEGEWDALALQSLGIMAITATAGCKSWPKQYSEMFRGRSVVIAYDNDKDGTTYDSMVAKNLAPYAKSIKRIPVPTQVGEKKVKDVSDWLKANAKARHRDFWLEQIDKAVVLVDNPDAYIRNAAPICISLDQASRSEHTHQTIRVNALVTGKDTAPYILPKKVRVQCSRSCEGCPLKESPQPFRDKELDTSHPSVLEMVDASSSSIKKIATGMTGMPCKPECKTKVEVLEFFNLEQLLLIPSLSDKTEQYVMRSSFFVGHGLRPNISYQFEGVTTPNPDGQHATHLFTRATPLQGEIDTFELTSDVRKMLQSFQAPTGCNGKQVLKFLNSIADWQSRHISKIKQRPDLHIAVDLVFHSVREFEFNGEHVKRGMLDVLVIGDTRCGKGAVAEGLTRYYGLGEIASGENCSFAGLIGGIDEVGRRRIVKWGIIPLNNGRMVVIDEASALAESDFGKLSRVRSEGIAEINKILREQTPANCRLIWLSNTRSGRHISSYNSGPQAIKELIGANEDISRFDFAMTVATNEVPTEVINSVLSEDAKQDGNRYNKEAFRAMVLWAWSREANHIRFTDAAAKEVIIKAIEFGNRYDSSIPLVQAENIRIKLAKIAVAIATRVYSTDETGELVMVTPAHVHAACEFIDMCYAKPSMSYDTFSDVVHTRNTIESLGEVDEIFSQLGNVRPNAIRALISINSISSNTLEDYVGDPITSKELLARLVQAGCVARHERSNVYFKNAAFTTWLREQHSKELHKK